jgi:hypothetical protein
MALIHEEKMYNFPAYEGRVKREKYWATKAKKKSEAKQDRKQVD